MNKESEVAKLFHDMNPEMCEESVWSNGTDYVMAFPIVSPSDSIFKSDLLGVEQLKYVKNAQDNWIEHGTNHELCVKPFLKHNVSNTITVDDWYAAEEYIYSNRHSLCGVSMLAASGDKAYPQAPFTEVLDLQDITSKYGEKSLFTSALIEAGLSAFNNDLWTAINTALGFGEVLDNSHDHLLKRDFVRRFNKFSAHFNSTADCGDCLKDVYNLHKWWRIQNNIKTVNWATDLAARAFIDVDTLASQGCSGGNCDVNF